MPDEVIAVIGTRLKEAQRILLVSHIRPDGDAIGSLLALGLGLLQAGKQVQMVLEDGVPATYRHLKGYDQVKHRAEGDFDLKVVVDCSDLPRAGKTLQKYGIPDINIDHHKTNLRFAMINLVEPEAVATSSVLLRHMVEWGIEITADVASALLTGIVADTIGFRTSNMTPEALRQAADLMEAGANLPEVYYHVLSSRSFQAARYWGAGLANLQREGRMIWTHLSLEHREVAGYTGNDDADLVNVLSAISEADVAIIFVEQRDGQVKISWRAQPGYDVSQIALMFGGGGHAAAAGAEVDGNLEDVKNKVLEVTRTVLNGKIVANPGGTT
jgi:phosphoesterase RecJ-like protein